MPLWKNCKRCSAPPGARGSRIGVGIGLLLFACAVQAGAQNQAARDAKFEAEIRDQVSVMLQDAYTEVKKHYYDPKFQGLDWDARYRQFHDALGRVRDLDGGSRLVAGFLNGLQDSHTYFIPPERARRYESGYRLTLVGDACFIARVRPGTDAESKLQTGDRVLRLNGFACTRGSFRDIEYVFGTLSPPLAYQFDLESPTGEKRRVEVKPFTLQLPRQIDLTHGTDINDQERRSQNEGEARRSRQVEFKDAVIWRLPEFDLSEDGVESAFNIARKRKTLILDLRDNGGGMVDTLRYIAGELFDHDVKICDRIGKNQPKPIVSKRRGKPYDGDLIVLVDSGSASASELLARVVQLEHRGKVIGDRTAGEVMEAKYYSDFQGVDTRFYYGYSVTDSNLIMSDGKSLEKTGVTPDEVLLPTAGDLAAGRDPVLAHAAQLAGVDLDPTAAGKLFRFEWLPL